MLCYATQILRNEKASFITNHHVICMSLTLSYEMSVIIIIINNLHCIYIDILHV